MEIYKKQRLQLELSNSQGNQRGMSSLEESEFPISRDMNTRDVIRGVQALYHRLDSVVFRVPSNLEELGFCD